MQVGGTEKAFIISCHSGVNTFTLKGIQLLGLYLTVQSAM